MDDWIGLSELHVSAAWERDLDPKDALDTLWLDVEAMRIAIMSVPPHIDRNIDYRLRLPNGQRDAAFLSDVGVKIDASECDDVRLKRHRVVLDEPQKISAAPKRSRASVENKVVNEPHDEKNKADLEAFLTNIFVKPTRAARSSPIGIRANFRDLLKGSSECNALDKDDDTTQFHQLCMASLSHQFGEVAAKFSRQKYATIPNAFVTNSNTLTANVRDRDLLIST